MFDLILDTAYMCHSRVIYVRSDFRHGVFVIKHDLYLF